MNIDNLHIGDVIKNYYALCDEIEEPIKSGKSKKYQLEDFMRYFTWEKSGHKFIITNIYNCPIPKKKKQNNLGHYRRKDNYNYNVNIKDNTKVGVYKIQLNDKVYIGSTIRGFRERFNKHVRSGQTMPHTKKIVDDGGIFEIIWIAEHGETETEIRNMEQYYINKFYNEGYEIVNESLKVHIKGEKNKKIRKISYKNIKINKKDYDNVIQLLQNSNIAIY